MRLICIGILVGWSSILVSGQDLVAEAALSGVPADGFYRVVITPDLAKYLNAACTNIRIYDPRNSEVPYLLQAGKPSDNVVEFKEYEIVEKRQDEGCCTTLVLNNPKREELNNINLIIKNADVTKYAELLGSDDQQHWFAIKQRFVLSPTINDKGTTEIKIVDFPLTNYSFYALRIEDSTSAPLNIVSAGYFQQRSRDGRYTPIPDPDIIKTDSVSQKKSYVQILFDTVRLVDRISVSLKGSPFFLRRATLFEPVATTTRKGRVTIVNSFLRELQLSSEHPTTIELGGRKIKELLLVVENEDNPPLEVDIHRAYQLERHLTAYLKKGMNYKIMVGREDLSSPVYDISFFKADIPSDPPALIAGPVSLLSSGTTDASFTIFTSRLFIWVVVAAVIAVLGFMSVRMIKETEKNGDKLT